MQRKYWYQERSHTEKSDMPRSASSDDDDEARNEKSCKRGETQTMCLSKRLLDHKVIDAQSQYHWLLARMAV